MTVKERVEHFLAADEQTTLPLHLFVPQGVPRGALLLFHGGGWMRGAPEMFFPQARLFAAAGILTASAGYRLVGSAAASPADCLADAARAEARFGAVVTEAGVARFAIGGGSAGAQLALALAMPADGEPVRRYAALVLFNPALDLCCARGLGVSLIRRRLGVTPEQARAASPLHHVRSGAPRSVVFHGTADRLVRIGTARRFCAEMRAAGNECDLIEFSGAGHGFFNSSPRGNPAFDRTVEKTTLFLLEKDDR